MALVAFPMSSPEPGHWGCPLDFKRPAVVTRVDGTRSYKEATAAPGPTRIQARKRLPPINFPGAPERIRVRASLAKRLRPRPAANL